MKIVRLLLFVPISAIVAVTIAFGLATVFPGASYSENDVLHSILGMAPSVMGRFVPVVVFVVLGTVIAPCPGMATIVSLGVIGGLLGWPFGPKYEIMISGPTFYLFDALGAVAGAAAGMLIGFTISRRRRSSDQASEISSETNPSGGTR